MKRVGGALGALLLVGIIVAIAFDCDSFFRFPQTAIDNSEILVKLNELEDLHDADPDDEESLYRLASGTWWLLSDVEKAQELYEDLLRLNSDHPGANFDLAQVLNMRGRYAMSIAHFQRFVDVQAGDSKRKKYATDEIERYEKLTSTDSISTGWRADAESAVNSMEMQFVRVPGGEFIMGYKDGSDDARFEHAVTLDPYWISVHEITAGQFKSFLDDTGYETRYQAVNQYARTPNHAAVFVTWNDAVAFTKWLSTREGRVYRLPSEAEWEFAARGTDGRTNPWGNSKASKKRHGNLGRFLNALSMGKKPTVESIGRYAAGKSFFGLHDMAGNASEWCLDYYDPDFYRKSPSKNPFGPSDPPGIERVLRGDSWRIKPGKLHAVTRGSWDAVTDYDCYGFRIVCEVNKG